MPCLPPIGANSRDGTRRCAGDIRHAFMRIFAAHAAAFNMLRKRHDDAAAVTPRADMRSARRPPELRRHFSPDASRRNFAYFFTNAICLKFRRRYRPRFGRRERRAIIYASQMFLLLLFQNRQSACSSISVYYRHAGFYAFRLLCSAVLQPAKFLRAGLFCRGVDFSAIDTEVALRNAIFAFASIFWYISFTLYSECY